MDEKTIWRKIVEVSNEILKVATAWAVIAGLTSFVFQDEIREFGELVELPEVVAEQQAQIDTFIKPEILEIEGRAIVGKKTLKAGETQNYTFFLRRVATCDTIVVQEYYDLDRNVRIAGGRVPAQKAPVTRQAIPFPIDIKLPDNIPPGRYVYWPLVIPVDCGVYREMRIPPSDEFTVVE